MNDIAGIPYREAEFDKNGRLQQSVTLPPGVTDLFVASHGWNNSADDARALYSELFTNFVAVGTPGDLPGRTFAIVGVIWPSKKFDELVAVAEAQSAEGSASIGGASTVASQAQLAARLDVLKALFTEPGQQARLDEAKALLPDLEDKATARRAFVEKIRSLLDPSAANKEDASTTFFKSDGNELMDSLKIDPDDLDPEVGDTSGSASVPLGVGKTAVVSGGAAGLRTSLSGFFAAALNVLNFTTYYEMKARAGTVGRNGVAALIDQLAPSVQRIHLVGHSFGGRVVTSAATNSTSDRIRSMSLLQTAFSHNGFSKRMSGFFRSVVDGKRVNGPILVTHTPNDKAVGVAYPLASRINGDKAAAFGDKNDVFGGLGRNGAQQMETGETVEGTLFEVGGNYAFAAGRFFNLESSAFIKDHGDVRGRQIAHAMRRAVATT